MDVSTDSESVADTSGLSDSDTEEPLTNLSDLRVPLEKGWKRETIIRGLTKNGQIRGDVFYYAPGTTAKLKHIGQIQTVRCGLPVVAKSNRSTTQFLHHAH